MINKAIYATQQCDTLRSKVESLKDTFCSKNAQLKEEMSALARLKIHMSLVANRSYELRALKDIRD